MVCQLLATFPAKAGDKQTRAAISLGAATVAIIWAVRLCSRVSFDH